MRVTAQQVQQVQAGYILIADVLGEDMAEFYVAGTRENYGALLADLTSRDNVLQVHSRRVAHGIALGKSSPSSVIVEDLGTMAGYLWSGDEFALDGHGEEEEQ